MIVVIDYGMGNLKSVVNALELLNIRYKVTSEKREIYEGDALILPGVGAYSKAIDNLNRIGIMEVIKEKVKKGTPILGICLGMQMLYEKGYEGEEREGLGFLKGNIKLMKPLEKVKIPHIGWNRLEFKREHKISQSLSKESFMYFVHSYMAVDTLEEEVIAYAEYGKLKIPALVGRGKVIGAQFHPEKSGEEGLKILKTFGEMQG